MTSRGGQWREAAGDLGAALSRPWLWTALGWSDIRQRYRGSLLGTLWITVNIGLLVAGLTLVFAELFDARRAGYAPYVAIGLVIWYFVQATLNDATQAFVASVETIRHTAMPLTVHVLRLVWRNMIVLGHNLLIVPVVLFSFGIAPGAGALLAVPGLLLLIFATFWTSLLLALLGARFRDVGQIVSNLLQLFFFMTPIFWPVESLGPGRRWIVELNPLFPFFDIVRSPLLGAGATATSWGVALLLAAVAAGLAMAALALFRGRVAYWL